jgi:hypothetical protein
MREDMQRGAEERSWWTEKDGEQTGHGVHGRSVPILSLFLFVFFWERPVRRKELPQSASISFLGLLPLIFFRPSFVCFHSRCLSFLSYILGDPHFTSRC